MRMNCPQCGASLQMLDRDFYVRCPYCGARIPWSLSGRDVRIARAVLDESGVSRMFESGSLGSIRLKYFPYALEGSSLVPVFNQPVTEMEGYTPPAGEMVQFDRSMVDPDQIVPPGDWSAGFPLVFHPVWIVVSGSGGAASYVDAVSGSPIGRSLPGPAASERPSRVFRAALAAGLAGSLPLYAAGVASRGGPADLFGVALAGALAGVTVLWLLTRRRSA